MSELVNKVYLGSHPSHDDKILAFAKIESLCRQQYYAYHKNCLLYGRKHCGKRIKCC